MNTTQQVLAKAQFACALQHLQPRFKVGRLQRYIAQTLQTFHKDMMLGRCPKLLLVMPPRHGKSSICAESFPVWCLLNAPTLEVVVASYALKVARDRVQHARDLMLAQTIKPTRLDESTRSKIDWRLLDGGGCFATGASGALTGLGADLLVLDDLHKDWQEAQSTEQRQARWDWLQSVALTRLSPNGAILAVGTRWHTDDTLGRLAEQVGWQVVTLPAIATSDSQWRKQGQPLDAERFPLERLEEIKQAVGDVVWECLYQCNPVPSGVCLLTGLQTYTQLPCNPSQARSVIACDLSFGSLNGSRVSLAVWLAWQAKYYLVEEVCKHMSTTEAIAHIDRLAAKYPTATVLVEQAAGGWFALEQCKCRPQAVVPQGSKIARAQAVQPLFNNVFAPATATDFINEITTFPQGRYNDRVDTTTMALQHLAKKVHI